MLQCQRFEADKQTKFQKPEQKKKKSSLSNFSSVANLITESEADWLKSECIKSITALTREPKIKDVMLPDGLKVGKALPKLVQ